LTPSPPRWRLIIVTVLRSGAVSLFAALVGGLFSLIVRDGLPVIGWLIYVPLVPLGAAAVVWELAARGRGLPKLRFALGLVGALALACGIITTLGAGFPTSAPAAPGVTPIAILQWNVRWGGGGGGRDGRSERWDSLCRDIAGRAPDIVVLSECPSDTRVKELEQTLGPAWTSACSRNAPRAPYLYSLVVAARWPVTLEREAAIPSGRVMQVTVAAPGGDVRVLVADGESHFWHDRTARLGAIAQFCRDAAASGTPIDLIAGDFNAVGRSIGFDAIAGAGFTSAGASGAGWRATWPSICPLYDIDHVWLSPRWTITSLERFTNLVTDHRGHIVRLNVR
jgi:endonuclease/exonuclease/phosphatase family metal-dependent hydrolase